MDPINAAIEEIESLGPGKTFSYQNIAKKYGVVLSRDRNQEGKYQTML
jgi:hypothetical protein